MLTDANPLPLCFFHSLFKLDSMIEKKPFKQDSKVFQFSRLRKDFIKSASQPPAFDSPE